MDKCCRPGPNLAQVLLFILYILSACLTPSLPQVAVRKASLEQNQQLAEVLVEALNQGGSLEEVLELAKSLKHELAVSLGSG